MMDRRARTRTAAPPPLRARIATLLIFVANGSGIGAWAATIPRLKAALSLSDAALGLGLLSVAAGAMICMPLAGRYGSRRASHRVAAATGVAFAAALILPGQAVGLATLVGAGLVMGAANGAMDVSMNGHASLVERGWGRAIMSSFHAAFSLGGFIGSLAVSLCAAAGLGPGATLLVAAGWVLLLTGGGAAIGLAVPAVAPVSPPAGARRDSARRVLLGLSALTFAAMLVEGGTADWSGVFLVTVAGAPIAAGAAVYGGFSIAMVVGRLLGDAVVRRLGRPMTLRAGAGLAAAGLALALAGATPLTGTIGFAIVGLGVANIIPTLFSAAARARPDAPGVGVSQAATLGYTGFLSGPPIIGAIADRIGLRLALVTLPVAVLAIVWRAGWAREPSIAEARE